VSAQTPDTIRRDTTALELPPIEVVGSIVPSAGPEIGSRVPARVTLITNQELEAREPRLFSDMLVTQPGFSAYDDLGSGYKMNISTRGFYASPVVGVPQGVSVFLDGIRQNEPDAAQVNWDLLPMEHIQRAELVSGVGSILGRNSLAGAINLVSRRGQGPFRAELEAAGGNFGAFSGEGAVSGVSRGGLDYYVGGGYTREDGWRQLTGAEQYNGFVNIGRLGPRSGIRFQAWGADSRAETAGSLPETVFDTRPDSNLSSGDYEDLYSVQGSVAAYTQLGTGRGSMSVYYRRHRAERFNVNQEDDPDVLGRSRNNIFGATADYRWLRELSPTTSLGLRVGGEGSTSRTEVELFADSTKFAGPVSQTTFVKSPNWDLAGFAIADLRVGRVTFSGGARLDHIVIPFRNQLDPTRDTTSNYTRFNPRGGIGVELGGGASVYGSVGTSFRAPAVIEVACADPEEPCPLPFALGDDPPIEPVKATTYEVGGQLVRGPVLLTASAYRTDVSDDIYLFPFQDENEPEGGTIDGFFGNIEGTRREGVELGSRLFLDGGHTVYANYAYTRATFRSEAEIFSIREVFDLENEVEVGDRLPLVPDHQVKLGGTAVLPKGFSVGADARYIGKQWLRGDEANETEPLGSYFVTDARIGWRGYGWEVSGIVTNVFQENYATFGTFNINQGGGDILERFLTPGDRRQFRLIVRRSFGPGARSGDLD
jgi:outer membrane cobalamin receptor